MEFNSKQIQKLTEMQHKADLYRGMIIGFSTSLENKINQFISEYFVADTNKRNDFVAVFFSTNGLNFRHKQKTLIHLVKSDNRFNSFLSKYPDFENELDIIVSNRNDMAHSKLLSTIENIDSFDGNNFKLQSYKPSNKNIFKEKIIEIDYNTLKAETDKIMSLSMKIDELL